MNLNGSWNVPKLFHEVYHQLGKINTMEEDKQVVKLLYKDFVESRINNNGKTEENLWHKKKSNIIEAVNVNKKIFSQWRQKRTAGRNVKKNSDKAIAIEQNIMAAKYRDFKVKKIF